MHIEPGRQADVQDELVYSAISSNRNERNISCQDEYLLYSKCRCPIVYNLSKKQLAACLIGHKDEVNGQCFVDNPARSDDASELHVISTAHDNSAIIWRLSDPSTTASSQILYHIESPDGSLFQTRCSVALKKDVFVSLMTTIDGNIYLYRNEQLLQTIKSKHCYFDAKFYSTVYNDSNETRQERHHFHFISLASSDNKVHIYQLDNQQRLVHLIDLAGFNDWIKCIDFLPLPGKEDEFLLAAACQDSLIQVWQLQLTSLHIDEAARVRTNVSKPLFLNEKEESNIRLAATLETVLSGHESFVYSLCWFRSVHREDPNLLQLISCSADRTIIIWQSRVAQRTKTEQQNYEQQPASEGVWKQAIQLGETGEANMPFLGVCLSQDESFIYAESYRGAIHIWSVDRSSPGQTMCKPQQSITGHFDAITDIVWSRSGDYLLSASLDKTCRLYGTAHEDNKWHELARPQVHGFEINCLAPLSSIKFASGAEEKTIRTFEATQFFVKNFEALTGAQLPLADSFNDTEKVAKLDDLPAHAQLPALGLSNRGSEFAFDVCGPERGPPVADTNGPNQKQSGDSNSGIAKTVNLSDNNSWHEVSELAKQLASIDHLTSVPHEEILLQSTLWWEKNKLFGHCNELHALASTSDGGFLASASKANRLDLASVIVWDTDKFRKVATLEHHSLTVTRLRFSPDDRHLLSVSRDRTWCLFERNPSGQLRNAYRKMIGTNKSNAVHERIIWDCAWTCDSKMFCTVSRDKSAIVWCLDRLKNEASGDGSKQSGEPKRGILASQMFDQSIQAVDSPAETIGPSIYLFAFGFEDGSLELHSLSAPTSQTARPDDDNQTLEWRALKRFDSFHQLAIRRLTFQPIIKNCGQQEQQRGSENNVTSQRQSRELLLASGGDDCILRLTRLRISQEPE